MGQMLAYEWQIMTARLGALLPALARENGTLHLTYNAERDTWIVVNDAGLAAKREQAVEAIRAAVQP